MVRSPRRSGRTSGGWFHPIELSHVLPYIRTPLSLKTDGAFIFNNIQTIRGVSIRRDSCFWSVF